MTVRIINGDCREMLTTLPAKSVHMVVTSPPYWGLRDYGVDGQIGLEPTPDEFVAEMVAVFREVRRVLRDDGTVWLNLGDSYSSGGRDNFGSFQPGTKQATHTAIKSAKRPPQTEGIKPKDMIGIPWMVAFALRADGWWLRKDIIWAKPNPMPESATDRPTSSHEHVFLLAKAERYFFDAEAVREGLAVPDWDNGTRTYGGKNKHGANVQHGNRTTGRVAGKVKVPGGWDQGAGAHGTIHRDGRTEATYQEAETKAGRNIRDVWTIATSPFPEAHFATFPPELAERCIKAGTSEKGCCAACGAPWARVVETSGEWRAQHERTQKHNGDIYRTNPGGGIAGADTSRLREDRGWQPSCQCNAAAVPCAVLDPFAGAFTTALVADRLRRDAIGIELNPEYCEMARRRLTKDAGMFADLTTGEP